MAAVPLLRRLVRTWARRGRWVGRRWPAGRPVTGGRICWWLLAAGVAAAGGVAAVVTMPFSAIVLIFGCAAGMSARSWVLSRRRDRSEAQSAVARRSAVQAWVAAAALVASIGVLAVTGWSGLTLLTLLAVTSPPALARLRIRFPGVLPERGRHPGAPRPSSLTTEQLCRAWRHSFATVTRARTAAERAAAARLRGSYLDELERRDPAGFATWLATGPPPGSTPAGFVRGGPGAESRGRWGAFRRRATGSSAERDVT